MAIAMKCDICGRYSDVPERDSDFVDIRNTNMVRVLRLKPNTDRTVHDVMQFDACDDCLQDVLDFMLSKRADSDAKGDKICV